LRRTSVTFEKSYLPIFVYDLFFEFSTYVSASKAIDEYVVVISCKNQAGVWWSFFEVKEQTKQVGWGSTAKCGTIKNIMSANY